jgi:hypothetical protein
MSVSRNRTAVGLQVCFACRRRLPRSDFGMRRPDSTRPTDLCRRCLGDDPALSFDGSTVSCPCGASEAVAVPVAARTLMKLLLRFVAAHARHLPEAEGSK